MPLPPPSARQALHERRLQMHGYERDDGLFDIEGHLVDVKPLDFQVSVGPLVPAGRPVHEMWVRLTIDLDFVVREAIAATDAAPYGDCRSAPASLARIVGMRIGGGWSREVKERLGGVQGCTHLMEMLIPMGTTAIQSLFERLRDRPPPTDRAGRPRLIDSCHALASDRQVVAMRWPQHYTGPRKMDEPPA